MEGVHHSEVIDLQSDALLTEMVVLVNAVTFQNWRNSIYREYNGCETSI